LKQTTHPGYINKNNQMTIRR